MASYVLMTSKGSGTYQAKSIWMVAVGSKRIQKQWKPENLHGDHDYEKGKWVTRSLFWSFLFLEAHPFPIYTCLSRQEMWHKLHKLRSLIFHFFCLHTSGFQGQGRKYYYFCLLTHIEGYVSKIVQKTSHLVLKQPMKWFSFSSYTRGKWRMEILRDCPKSQLVQ